MNDYELKLKEYKDKVLKDDKELFENTTATGTELKLEISKVITYYGEQVETALSRISSARYSNKSEDEINTRTEEWIQLKIRRDFWKNKLVS